VRLASYLIFLLLAAFIILTGICIPPNVPALKTLPPGAQFYPQSLCPAWAIALYVFAIGAILSGLGARQKAVQQSSL